jgi:hypothetical protein
MDFLRPGQLVNITHAAGQTVGIVVDLLQAGRVTVQFVRQRHLWRKHLSAGLEAVHGVSMNLKSWREEPSRDAQDPGRDPEELARLKSCEECVMLHCVWPAVVAGEIAGRKSWNMVRDRPGWMVAICNIVTDPRVPELFQIRNIKDIDYHFEAYIGRCLFHLFKEDDECAPVNVPWDPIIIDQFLGAARVTLCSKFLSNSSKPDKDVEEQAGVGFASD